MSKCSGCGIELGSADSAIGLCWNCAHPHPLEEKKAQTCPVCGGKGSVPWGFYDVGGVTMGGQIPPTCKSCDGKGYVVV